MKVDKFASILGVDFYTGVPDSQLKALCDYLISKYGTDPKYHIIAANEGNCTALAAGYHLATGKVPAVYMQNSGEGNVINPVVSLMNDKVYGIPCIFIIGWRGEPGMHDEPQHVYQGEVTLKLLEDMNIQIYIVDRKTTESMLITQMNLFKKLLQNGKQVALVIRKGALELDDEVSYSNDYFMLREEIIRHIVDVTDKDIVVSTTGKASRELFEIRESNGQLHDCDFLTVGSMGHSSSIALGIALHKPDKKVWMIDGDGAVLMHMGSMAVIGTCAPQNLVHIVINNGAHETVGGQPTVAGKIDFVEIAKGCGYSKAVCADSYEKLDEILDVARERKELCFIEVKCGLGARSNLGRPTISTIENKENFIKHLVRTSIDL